jgi:hypothetical protein
LRAVSLAVVLLGGASLGALRVTPGDDGGSGPDQAFNVVGASSSPTTAGGPLDSITVPPTTAAPTTVPPTTAAPATARVPLSPLAPSPPTTRPPAPTTTAPPPPPVNHPPVANADSAETTGLNEVTIQVLANDSDPEGNLDPNTLQAFDYEDRAIVTLGERPGELRYTPKDDGFKGNDTFRYQICDSKGACSVATVTVRRR